MNFCDCGTLLDRSTKNGLIFQCPKCRNKYDSKPEDTLIYRTGAPKNEFANIANIIINAPYIASIPKIDLSELDDKKNTACKGCDRKIVSSIRHNDQKMLFICQCGRYWK